MGTKTEKSRIALMDLGSNSSRMTIFEIDGSSFAPVKKYRDYVRLSEGLQETGTLSLAPMQRTIASLVGFVKKAKEKKADKMILLATEAVRRAENKEEFLSLVQSATGLTVQILPGEKESYYDYLGSKELVGEKGVLLDVGGGSFELVCVSGGNVVFDACLPEGSVVTKDRFLDCEKELLPYFTEKFQSMIPEAVKGGSFVALGGTARAAHTLLCGEKPKKKDAHGQIVSKDDLYALYQRIAALSVEERRNLPIVGEERGDILLSGLAPLVAAASVLNADMILSSHGVREGFLREYIQNL
ncbi:MAG: hypothetical protein II359_06485 [Clostridia bacterium]|nr:hypothetical protein [Clostridia bacterium]